MTDYDYITTLAPPPEGAQCDFCPTTEGIHWSYPCRDHAQKREHAAALVLQKDGSLDVEKNSIDGFSYGGWAACEVCHRLIEAGKREALARRSAKMTIAKAAKTNTYFLLSDLTALIRRLHDQFWANREGPPVYHEDRPRKDPTR